MPGAPEDWKELPPESAALLVEFGADDRRASSTRRSRGADEILGGHETIRAADFTRDAGARSSSPGACARACTG